MRDVIVEVPDPYARKVDAARWPRESPDAAPRPPALNRDAAIDELPPGETDASPPSTNCPPGNSDCPCHSNGTCNVVDRVPLECRNGLCAAPSDAPEVDLGDACATDRDCHPYFERPLACLSGRCVAPGCPTGTTGCPCAPGGACEGDTACADPGFCVAAECEAGTPNCPCQPGDMCTATLRCLAGLCRDESIVAFVSRHADTRSCEGRFEFGLETTATLSFDPSLRGQQFRRGRALGFGFVTTADAPAVGARLAFTLQGAANPGDVVLTESRCYDRLGNLIPGAGLGPAR